MIDFGAIIKKSSTGFEDKVKDRLRNRINEELVDKGLPSFSDIQNIQKDAFQKVLKNHNWEGNSNENFGIDLSKYINNSITLGLANKTAANEDIKNNPIHASTTRNKNVPWNVLRYPLPSDEESIPYMEIKGFKYQSDATDKIGNKGSSRSEETSTERTATIILPLPGNLASGLSVQYEDYNSVFSKLVRAYNGAGDADTMSMTEQFKSFFDSMEEGVWKQGVSAGVMAGAFSAMMQDGSGSIAANTIDETLKYVRVQAGIAINPMSQASYVGANIRTHSFEFNMVPRSKHEALECKKIIEMLQYCSLGEKRKEIGGILMNFPSVWNVSFKNHDGKPINGMLEIPDSFLTEVNVTYSPTRAGFTVTRDNDPFAYVLTMTFKEAQNLVRDDLSYIRQGGSLFSEQHPATSQKFEGDKVNFDAAAATAEDANTATATTASTDNNNPAATPVPPKKPITAAGVLVTATATGMAKVKQANDVLGAGAVYNAGKAVAVVKETQNIINKASNVLITVPAVTVLKGMETIKEAHDAMKGGKN